MRTHLLLASATFAALTVLATSSSSVASVQPLLRANGDSVLLASYRWRSIGPDRGGRSIAVSGVRGRPKEAYFGAVGGGLWKTMDGGETWGPVTDGQIRSASVGAVAVSESNPDVVYIGMGETCIRGNIMSGDGMYKSTDAGKTWTHSGLAATENISKIRIHPTNPDIVFAAAFGKHSAPSPERGVFKSTDGGRSWRRVLFRDDSTGAIDIVFTRNSPDVIYAALWQAFRKEYTMSSGGAGSGVFKSTDGGETWSEITRNPGLPQGMVGRIGLAVSDADPNRVYALVENENGGLFRSDDGGATWSTVNQNRAVRQRAFYYTHVFADPKNADVVYMQNVGLFRSTDGGKTTQQLRGTHSDHHDLWIDPDDPTHIVDGNDGGGAVSYNTGESWTAQDFPTAQWYHVITTKHLPYHVCGAQQDNSTLCVPSSFGLGGGGFGGGGGGGGGGAGGQRRELPPGVVAEPTRGAMEVAYTAAGGEPGYIAPDPRNFDVFFSGTNNGGWLHRYDRRTGHVREVNPYPWMYSGEPAREIRERWQWTYPIIFSKADPNVLFTSSQRLWKTTNDGQSWTAISGDLTRHDPATQGHSGGPITGDMNGPEVYGVIFSIGPSKRDVNVIWTGSDDGLVHVTRDGGKTWTNVTPREMPEFGRVSQIDASAFDAGTAYISVRRPLLDDKSPYIFRTRDFGRTWSKIVTGIRADDWVHAVREDFTRRGLLYAAAQHGVYLSYDDGASWRSLSLNLPDVPVHDLVVEANDLVIGTHGRGFYILDNIWPLRQYSAGVDTARVAHLFSSAPGVRSAGPVPLTYWLKQPARNVRIEFADSAGNTLRAFSSDSTGREPGTPRLATGVGIQRTAWDLRTRGAATFPGMILWGSSTTGPVVPPGRYSVRLTVDGTTRTQPLIVRRNPNFANVSDADLRAQYSLGRRVRDRLSEANEAVIRIRALRDSANVRLKASTDAALATAGKRLVDNLSDVEDDIYQVKNQSGQDPLNFPIKINNRFGNLSRIVNFGDGRPTQAMQELFVEYGRLLDVELARLRRVEQTDLAAFNAEVRRLGLAGITVVP